MQKRIKSRRSKAKVCSPATTRTAALQTWTSQCQQSAKPGSTPYQATSVFFNASAVLTGICGHHYRVSCSFGCLWNILRWEQWAVVGFKSFKRIRHSLHVSPALFRKPRGRNRFHSASSPVGTQPESLQEVVSMPFSRCAFYRLLFSSRTRIRCSDADRLIGSCLHASSHHGIFLSVSRNL